MNTHFIDLMQATPAQIWRLYSMPMLVPCPYCEGAGYRITETEDATLNVFGISMEGTVVHAEPCQLCLPTYPGYTYAFCSS